MPSDADPFHVLIVHLHILFGERSVHVFCPFSHWIVFSVLSFESPFYTPDTRPCWIGGQQTLSTGLELVFSSSSEGFSLSQSLCFYKSSVSFIFPFMDCAFCVKSEKSLPHPRSCWGEGPFFCRHLAGVGWVWSKRVFCLGSLVRGNIFS